MDLKLITKLIKLMQGGEVTELELEDEKLGLRVRLKRGSDHAPAAPAPMVHVMHGAPAPALSHASAAAPLTAPSPEKPAAPAGTPILSPMVGTFYRSPTPEAEAFVRVGQRLELDAPLCIIEAMKVMNEIKSEVSGELLAILVENGEPVEFGQPLFLLKTD